MITTTNISRFTAFALALGVTATASFCGNIATAQTDFTMFSLRNVQQSRYTNVAFMPDRKVNIGFPLLNSLYFSADHNGFAWNDLFQPTPNGDSLTLNMDNAIAKMNDVNRLAFNSRIDLLHFGFRVKKNYFSFNVTEKANFTFSYPKELVQLVWEGNGKNLLGQRASFDGIGFDGMHYREHGFGYTREVNDNLTVGGRVKWLQGSVNVWSKNTSFGLSTDATSYALTIDGNYDIYTSGLAPLLDSTAEFDAQTFLYGTENTGIGIDIGGVYNFNERLEVSAAVNDIGSIAWNTDVARYTAEGGSFSFEGIDLIQEFGAATDSTEESGIASLVDSLIDAFTAVETEETYRTPLSPQIYLGGRWYVTKKSSLNGMIFGRLFKGSLKTGWGVAYNVSAGKIIDATVNYSLYNGTSNIGAGFALNLGAVQLYASADNVLAIMAPHRARMANIRLGLNLIFGHEDKDRGKLGHAGTRPVLK